MRRTPLVRGIMDDLRRIVQALRTSHRAAEHVHLTGAQLFVLSVLNEAGGPVSIGDVAREAQTDPSTASVVVGRLVDAGYVRRQRASDDSRRVELSLTTRARTLLRNVPLTAPQRKLARALQRLRPSNAKTFARLLHEITENMGLSDAPAPMMFGDETLLHRGRARSAAKRVDD
ncbi:MAG: MarR family transcriptional regulator [Acidobacteriota bacterium]|nr:MarR family transcriptional regulator [Acidobacteriota bacterium]